MKYVTPVSFALFAVFSVSALLNVCFLWVELANTAILNMTSRSKMRKHSLRMLRSLCCFYFSMTLVIFFTTSSYNWIAVLTVLYTICIGFAFLKGAMMISKKLMRPTSISEDNERHSIILQSTSSRAQSNLVSPNNSSSGSESDAIIEQSEKEEENDHLKFYNGVLIHDFTKVNQQVNIALPVIQVNIKSNPIKMEETNEEKHQPSKKSRVTVALHDLQRPVAPEISTSRAMREHSSLGGKTGFVSTRSSISAKTTTTLRSKDLNARKVLTFTWALSFHCVLFCVALVCYFLFSTPSVRYYQFLSCCLVIADALCIHLWILHYLSGGNMIPKKIRRLIQFCFLRANISRNSFKIYVKSTFSAVS